MTAQTMTDSEIDQGPVPQHLDTVLADIDVHPLTMADLHTALKAGFEDFLAKPSHLFLLGLIYPIAGALAAVAAAGGDFLPLVYPLVGGYALMGPFAAIILYEASRRREAGEDFSWSALTKVLQGPSAGAIARLGMVLLAIFLLWLALAQLIFEVTLGGQAFTSTMDFSRLVFNSSAGLSLMLIGNATGFVLAAAVLSMFIVSFPLLLDRNVGAMAAIVPSVRVTLASPAPVAIWGLIIAASMIAGGLLFLVGLAVVLPVVGHASWHLYRRAVTLKR